MGYIVMAFAAEGYQEYMLPELDDADYNILLERNTFGLNKELEIALEVVDGIWKFVASKEYRLRDESGETGFGRSLEDGKIFTLKAPYGVKIALAVLSVQEAFPTYKKYSLDRVSSLSIGKGEANGLTYDFRGYISKSHAVIFRYGEHWIVQDMSSNGTFLNGKRVQGQSYLKFGDQITFFGLRIIYLQNYLAICAMSGEYHINDSMLIEWKPRAGLILEESEIELQEKQFFKRSPRTVEGLYTENIEIEAPPQLNKTKKRPLLLTIGPSMTMAIPMLLGCVMAILSAKSRGGSGGIYMFTGVVTAVSSAMIGMLWALTNIRYTSREEEENEEHRYNAYGQYLIEITDFIKEKYDKNTEILFKNFLSGQECCSFSRGDARLWNHNEKQQDFLAVRLGTATIPFQAEIVIPKDKFSLMKDDLALKPAIIKETYQELHAVPFCIDIRQKGVIGIVGGSGKRGAYEIAHNMVAQLAANTCYTDLKMVFIYREGSEINEKWSFAKWLPHVWTEDKKTRLIASNKSELGDIFYEMSRVFRMRTEEQMNKRTYPLPHYVFFIDDMGLLEGELSERFIYKPAPEYGITTVLLVEKYEDLPNSCENIIQNDGSCERFFNVYSDEETSRNLVFDTVSMFHLELLARRLCDIKVNEVTGSGEIPDSLDFFEMYEVGSLEQLNVLERWKKNRNYETMRVPIGQKAGGNLCYLDIHEKYHGPHGLVAGTTGSGKSETLQTYILSLAVNFSPDDIAFFIIDFKGGGMANLFSGLPHMAGQISNLSGNQIRRAMISIKSENMRRQQVFADHNVNNINAYTKLYKNHEAEFPVPHLFIIIDEFAELKREEPEFMKELISVAQVGRSLGVHLILATQKPSGTVDDNIWSNSKFRLCLRVQDRQDSNDMLHKPDAAYITQAGRGFLQVGNDEIFEQFQSGYSGADYVDDPKLNRTSAAVMITLNGKEEKIGGSIRKRKVSTGKNVTQLDAIIKYLGMVAKKHDYDHNLLLWLPVLPEKLYLKNLKGFSNEIYHDGVWPAHHGKWALKTVVGLYDDPVHQAQEPLTVHLDSGHLAVCGTVSTGKSTFLQTMLYGLIHKYSPQELNFYALDYSGRLLLPFEEVPHCGGVIIDTDVDKVKKFFYMLSGIMDERKHLLKGGNYSQYMQSGKTKEGLPAIVVVIDNYANFREKTNNQFDDAMLRISREGVGYGIFLILSSGGFGASEIPTRVGDNIRTVISLEMGDKFKYAEVLHTTRLEVLPEINVKGRGLAYVHGSILEFQTALAEEAEDAYAILEQIEQCCETMAHAWSGVKARRIPVIPERPTLQIIENCEEYRALRENRRYLPFGYYEKDASICSVDLWNSYCYMIQGRSRTGKKNMMKLLMYAASKKENASLCLIDLSGDLQKTAEQLSIEHVSDAQGIYDYFKNTIPVFKERNAQKRDLISKGMEDTEIAEIMNQNTQKYIFISDVVRFVETIYKKNEDVGNIYPYLENITEKGSNHGFFFIGILNSEQNASVTGYRVYQNMVSYKTGIHLGGNVGAQRMFQFTSIPFQEQTKSTKPGIGLMPSIDDPGMAQEVIIPFVKGGIA